MKQFFLTLLSAGVFVSAQAQSHTCGTEVPASHLNRSIDPVVLKQYQSILKEQQQNAALGKKAGTIIIPVVVHVIHEYGTENISKAQIEDQLRVLNADMKRLNADTGNTRSQFKGDAGKLDVEFRLAHKDPSGNCTDGIVRVYSPLTNNARDNVKSLSYWDSKKYFNIWVVKTIQNFGGDPGSITLGYAQFPGDDPVTDGVVVRHDFFGSIGTGSRMGRTLTHEVGHWLGLYHTFQGGCSSGGYLTVIPGLQISDIPRNADASFGCNLNKLSCDGVNKAMIENYMDYADDACMNMFSNEQTAAMATVISSYRSQLVSSTNLTNTGVADPYVSANDCKPVADFYTPARVVCNNMNINFYDNTYNGTPSSYIWTLNGSNTPVSTDKNPVVVYNNPGTYTVKLQVTNSKGIDTITKTGYITVQNGTATAIAPYMEDFTKQGFPYANWTVDNSIGNDWQYFASAGHDAPGSIRIVHYNNSQVGNITSVTSEAYDTRLVGNTRLYFWVAYAPRTSSSADQLRVLVSTDCGITWTQRAVISGTALSNGKSNVATSYTPSAAGDWVMKTINLPANMQNVPNLKVRFEATNVSYGGNNIYLDDIYLASYPVGVEEHTADAPGVHLFPNPASGQFTLSLDMIRPGNGTLTITDMAGRSLRSLELGDLPEGNSSFDFNTSELGLSSGVYLLQLQAGETNTALRLLVD